MIRTFLDHKFDYGLLPHIDQCDKADCHRVAGGGPLPTGGR